MSISTQIDKHSGESFTEAALAMWREATKSDGAVDAFFVVAAVLMTVLVTLASASLRQSQLVSNIEFFVVNSS